MSSHYGVVRRSQEPRPDWGPNVRFVDAKRRPLVVPVHPWKGVGPRRPSRPLGNGGGPSATVGLGAAPAAASVDSNPNADTAADVTCPGTDLSFELVWSPTMESPVGLDLDQGTVGVVKAAYLAFPDGTRVPVPEATLFERPGKGLDKNMVSCIYPYVDSPTGFVGVDILFTGSARP
jgi:hypothetical protein